MAKNDSIYFHRMEQRLKGPEFGRKIDIAPRVSRILDAVCYKEKMKVHEYVNEILRKHIENMNDEIWKEFLNDESYILEFCPAFQIRKGQNMTINEGHHSSNLGEE